MKGEHSQATQLDELKGKGFDLIMVEMRTENTASAGGAVSGYTCLKKCRGDSE